MCRRARRVCPGPGERGQEPLRCDVRRVWHSAISKSTNSRRGVGLPFSLRAVARKRHLIRRRDPANHNVCGLEASVCHGPVVARDDPSPTAYQFGVSLCPLLFRGNGGSSPVVVIEIDDWQARWTRALAARVVFPEATGPTIAIRSTAQSMPDGCCTTGGRGSRMSSRFAQLCLSSTQLVRAIVGAGRYWRLGGAPPGIDPPAMHRREPCAWANI